MIKDKVLESLKENARNSFTNIAMEHKLPVTTVFNRVKALEKKKIISKYTVMIDFPRMGYPVWSKVVIKADKKQRSDLKNFLLEHAEVNSIYELSSGYDFFVETVHKDSNQRRDFLELIEDKFDIDKKEVYDVIKLIK